MYRSDDNVGVLVFLVLVFFLCLAIDYLPGKNSVTEEVVLSKQVDRGRYLIVTGGEDEPTKIYSEDGSQWQEVEIGQVVTVQKRIGWISKHGYSAEILGE